MKAIKFILFSVLILVISGCDDVEQITKDITDAIDEKIQEEATKDNEYLLSVKGGSLNNYPDEIVEDAFDKFFSSPTWHYFEADTGEHVVEFSGYCVYMDEEVKAELQFIVDEDLEQFNVGALSFNDVPQSAFMTMALLSAIFEGSGINTPLKIGDTLDDLLEYYGDPTYDDYYLGGRLVVFDEEDGYFIDDGGYIYGYYLSNPTIEIYGTHVGMTPLKINEVFSEPADSYFDEVETQEFISVYYVEDYEITYAAADEFSETTSVMIFPVQ